MSFNLPLRGSSPSSGDKGNGTEDNVLGDSSVIAGKKRGSEMIDVKNEDAESAQDYSKFTVVNLRAVINDRGIAKKGARLKEDLIALLEAYDQDPTAHDASGGDEDSKNVPASSSRDSKSKSASSAASSEPKAKKPKKVRNPKPPPYVQPEDFDPVDHNSMATGEKRLRTYQPFPDKDIWTKMWRARTERMFMLGRSKGIDRSGNPQETFQIAGSKGNVYQVVFGSGNTQTCTCINARMGGQQRCKHMIYVKVTVLKVEGNLVYQTAYLPSEIQEIFANAPATQLPLISGNHIEDETIYNGKRKPVEDDCPVCVMPFEDGDELVWCKAACGQNFHKVCMDQWKDHSHGQVKCVFCRTPWQEDTSPDPFSRLMESAPKIGSYKNIGHLPIYQDHDEE